MMTSPEAFYEMNLKGKTPAEIMTVIRGLKREIGRLKKIAEHPKYQCMIHPCETVRIECSRDYLERAKQALVEAGGTYEPSVAEKKVMDFDANIPYIDKVVFSIGGYPDGEKITTYTVIEDKVSVEFDHSLWHKPVNIGDDEIEPWEKAKFLEELKSLHIGEWRRTYYIDADDGTQWKLEIYFSNGHKPVKINGSNAYPYNFDRALDFF